VRKRLGPLKIGVPRAIYGRLGAVQQAEALRLTVPGYEVVAANSFPDLLKVWLAVKQ